MEMLLLMLKAILVKIVILQMQIVFLVQIQLIVLIIFYYLNKLLLFSFVKVNHAVMQNILKMIKLLVL